MKQYFKFSLAIVLTVIARSMVTAYFAARNIRAAFVSATYDMEAVIGERALRFFGFSKADLSDGGGVPGADVTGRGSICSSEPALLHCVNSD